MISTERGDKLWTRFIQFQQSHLLGTAIACFVATFLWVQFFGVWALYNAVEFPLSDARAVYFYGAGMGLMGTMLFGYGLLHLFGWVDQKRNYGNND